MYPNQGLEAPRRQGSGVNDQRDAGRTPREEKNVTTDALQTRCVLIL